MKTETADATEIELRWRDTDIVLVDQITGFTAAENIARVSFAQLIFVPGAQRPAAQPVVSLASTTQGWIRIRSQIDDIIKALEGDQSEILMPKLDDE